MARFAVSLFRRVPVTVRAAVLLAVLAVCTGRYEAEADTKQHADRDNARELAGNGHRAVRPG